MDCASLSYEPIITCMSALALSSSLVDWQAENEKRAKQARLKSFLIDMGASYVYLDCFESTKNAVRDTSPANIQA